MSQTQKVIKYLAIAFAIFLIVSIISGIMFSLSMFTGIFNQDVLDEMKTFSIENSKTLKIDVKTVNLSIKIDEQFKIETNNKYIEVNESLDKIAIKENSHSWFKNNKSQLIIYIPSNYEFDKIDIDSGAGKIDIESLNTKILNLDLGAGNILIDDLTVSNNIDIDGGAGNITISNANINNLDLDMGVGNLSLSSYLTGNSKIDGGVGNIDLNLIGNQDDYKIKIEKGIGKATIDNNSVSNTTYGNGNNYIDIDCGVGEIVINFENKL